MIFMSSTCEKKLTPGTSILGGPGPQYFAKGAHPSIGPPIIKLQQATKSQVYE